MVEPVDLWQFETERAVEALTPAQREPEPARSIQADDPAARECDVGDRGSDRARDVIASLAPVEAWPKECASLRTQCVGIDAESAQPVGARGAQLGQTRETMPRSTSAPVTATPSTPARWS